MVHPQESRKRAACNDNADDDPSSKPPEPKQPREVEINLPDGTSEKGIIISEETYP